jgi:hypothetical protein
MEGTSNPPHEQVYDSSAAFRFESLNELATTAAGTSNRRHERHLAIWRTNLRLLVQELQIGGTRRDSPE